MTVEFQKGGGEFVIIEAEPSGSQTIKGAIKWFDDIYMRSNDARPLWKALTPDIKKAVNFEFSDANHNKWAPISAGWKKWKTEHNYPTTIGIRTGALKSAASDKAIIEYLPHKMNWSVNGAVLGGRWGLISEVPPSPWGPNTDKEVGDYASDFDSGRHLFIYTMEFIRGSLRNAIKNFVASITTKDE